MKKRLKDILEYEQPSKYIVDSQNYSDDYQIPVLTAGKSFILGYTNETEGVFEASKAPVIIFDDFTAASKYVDFDFKVKSSAMKILHLSDPINSLRYVYFAMQKIDYTPFSHKRIWISDYCNFEIELPTSTEQNRIVVELDTIQRAIDLKRKQLNDLDELVKSKFQEMFGDLRINEKKWSFVPLMEICDVRDGTHESPKYHLTGYPLLTSKNFTGGTIDFSDVKLISKEDYDAINVRSKVDIGDIVLPMIGTIGHPVVINVEPEFAIKNVALIKFKDSKFSNFFIKQVLDSEYFLLYVSLNNKGNTQKFVSLGDIRKFPIPIVPSSLQILFGEYVQKVDKAKLLLMKEMADLDELLDKKMDEYFGEKDKP